jgi:anti-sigma regulatory factor (Ser/Thr protein kinase)
MIEGRSSFWRTKKAGMAVEVADIAVDAGDHVVQFYEHESELAHTVGRYLSASVQTGGVAVVIATEPHHRAFESELKAAGIDSTQACLDGTLILLDAAATMAAFMPDGRIDGAAFREVVGSVMRQAGQAGRRVRAYGEMVALLWDAGDVLAAIELEELWNELGRELQFSLLCAYHTDSVSGPEHVDSLRHVCDLHSSILYPPAHDEPEVPGSPGAEVSAEFSAERDAPRGARHFVADILAGGGHAGTLLEDAELLVTELATNAVIHAHSPFSIVVRADHSRVRISVSDTSAVRPAQRDEGPMATSGHGLRLVAALSVDWGVEVTADGKTVWAELQG